LAAQHALRGADLRKFGSRRSSAAVQLGIPVTLAMTVTQENVPYLWDSIEYGLRWPHVRGISFQPMFTSGRVSQPSNSLNTADIILGAVEQSGGTLKFEDFTPLPCGDPNCATIGYLPAHTGGIEINQRLRRFQRSARASCKTRSVTRSTISRSADARANRSDASCMTSNSMSNQPSGYSSSRSWMRGVGMRIALIAAAPM
jgi:hypothetical protein